MGNNLKKSHPAPMRKIMEKEKKMMDERPPTLGEPTQFTNWDEHMSKNHKLKWYTLIRPNQQGQQMAYVHKPKDGSVFIPVKEKFAGTEFYYIWIVAVLLPEGRILSRINAGDVEFVEWDDPDKKEEEVKKEETPE